MLATKDIPTIEATIAPARAKRKKKLKLITIRRERLRGENGYVHPYVLEIVASILERVKDNIAHDRDLTYGADSWNACMQLGVPRELMRSEQYNEHVSEEQNTYDDTHLLQCQASADNGVKRSKRTKRDYRHGKRYFR